MRLLPEDRSLGWTRYAWLVYALFLFIKPAITGELADWLATTAIVAAFLPLYFLGYWLQGRRVLWVIGGLLVLALIASPINPAGPCLFIYAAGFVGQVGKPAVGVRYLLLILALIALEAWLVGIPGYSWVWGMVFTLVVGGINIHFSELGRSHAKLRLAHDEVERLATMAERERIARDLHDVLGHTLSLITIKSGLAARLADKDPERAGREMREIEEISRTALTDVRRAVRGYRFSSLGAEMAKAKVALAAAGVELATKTGPYDLTTETESAAALALREAVTNVVRHSRAENCRIGYRQADGEFRLRISDDGRGGEAAEGSGLAGMRERVGALGGTLTRDGSKGTRLTIILPAGTPRDDREAAAR
jgi:two-component system sensor histidine kinase DesK